MQSNETATVRQCLKTPAKLLILPFVSSPLLAIDRVGWCTIGVLRVPQLACVPVFF
jgi:hypothetical protein